MRPGTWPCPCRTRPTKGHTHDTRPCANGQRMGTRLGWPRLGKRFLEAVHESLHWDRTPPKCSNKIYRKVWCFFPSRLHASFDLVELGVFEDAIGEYTSSSPKYSAHSLSRSKEQHYYLGHMNLSLCKNEIAPFVQVLRSNLLLGRCRTRERDLSDRVLS